MGKSNGKVWLVGAGSGDPGLLTLRGKALLERCQVVVYDSLANPKLLDYCPPGCEQIYVGKRAAAHSMTQEQINALLVEKGKSGKRVVRLKGGDPFVFGRGGEEAEELVRAGVPFEVVPGVTASIAGPAYAGIPVTHRDFNSSFTLITGHEKEEEFKDEEARARDKAHGSAAGSSDIDWSVIAKLPCVAFYMGVKSLPRICQNLIDHGKPPQTPAATIQWGTTPKQRTVVGTIGDLPQRVADAKIGAPAITIVGRVVTMRQTLNWFESRPLFGKTIAVTRTRQQASELTDHLEELGASVIEAPTIELEPVADWSGFDEALGLPAGSKDEGRRMKDEGHRIHHSPFIIHPSPWDWIIFTSANGVRVTRDRLRALERDARAFGNAKIAAIGDATADAIREMLGLHVDLCPESFVAEALASALVERGQVAGKRFLLLRADIARPVLREKLIESHAAEVRDVAVYNTNIAGALPANLLEALDAEQVDWVTFTSSSTAKNFVTLLGSDYKSRLAKTKLASIGPITTQTLKDLGLEPTAQAERFDIAGLVRAIRAAI